MTEAERGAAFRRLFELCLWPIEYGARYEEEDIRDLTPVEMQVLTEELEKHSAELRGELHIESWPTELDV